MRHGNVGRLYHAVWPARKNETLIGSQLQWPLAPSDPRICQTYRPWYYYVMSCAEALGGATHGAVCHVCVRYAYIGNSTMYDPPRET